MPSAATNLRSDEPLSQAAQHPPRVVTFTQESPFALLPQRRPPWKEFVFSMGTQSVLLVLLAWLGVLHPEILTTAVHNDHFTPLVTTPVPVPQEPAPVRFFKTPVAHLEVPPARALPAPPKARLDQPAEAAEVPEAHFNEPQPAPVAPPTPVVPRQMVKTNVFSNGSSATPTIDRAPQQVQTGGFGDSDGLPASTNNGHPVNIAQLGSFDSPSGSGSGNGTAGSRGVRGVVASSGFGNGVATGDGSGRSNASRGNGVRASGFGDMEPAAAPTPGKSLAQTAATIPAEITSKPNPVYTDEARKLHIEGEVLLQVVFASSGRVRVVRVIRGLGHGLDEAAVRAAEQIRFKPALRDGKPADSTAVLHILFQLA